jgi:hypothetical protein
MSNIKDDDVRRDVLNRLVLKPRMKEAARNAGVHPTTLFGWIKQSLGGDPRMTLTWLGHEAPFHLHVNAARKLNIVALDHAARDLAVNGHREPRFHDGKPVYRRDPKIAADALDLSDADWKSKYGDRPRTDTFYRDPETGALEQEVVVHPPNPAILVKLLTSLAPDIYGEKATVQHVHSGAVWVEGGTSRQGALPPPTSNDFNQDFGLTTPREEMKRPTNTLAVPRPCVSSDEFDSRFRKKLLRNVTLFRDTESNLLPPLPDDVVVAGTPQARAFEDAGIEVTLVRAETLLDEGFENEWLRALAPSWKPKPKPKSDKPTLTEEEAAAAAAENLAKSIPPGRASAHYNSENIGRGTPKPGGLSVVR